MITERGWLSVTLLMNLSALVLAMVHDSLCFAAFAMCWVFYWLRRDQQH